MAIGTYISIITLNINGLNAPTKRHTLVDWIQKEDLYNMLYTRDPLQTYRHIHTESEGMEKYFYANGNQKKAGVAILISDKIDFKMKTVIRDKEEEVLHNNQGIDTRRRYNNCKYLCTQHRDTSIQKANANSHKKRGN